MNRRGFLLTPLALSAQSPRPSVALVWTTTGVPADVARDAIVFPRAYTCCPNRAEAAYALEHSRFPHSARASEPSLWDYFQRASAPANNTITVMTSHSADGADSPFDRSIRVPLAISWPGRLAPRVANEILFSHADILPTLLALAGIAQPPALHGSDLSSLLRNATGELPESVYSEGSLGTRTEWRAVVRGFEKITWNIRDEITGLYNLAGDPAEQSDLRDQRDQRLMRDSMQALARQWMDRLQDGRDAYGLRTRRP